MSAQTAVVDPRARAGVFSDASTSAGLAVGGMMHPMAFAYAAASHHHHHHHHLHQASLHHHQQQQRHHRGLLLSTTPHLASGRVGIDPSAYGHGVSGGNPFGDALLAVPAAAAAAGVAGVAGVAHHPRVLLPTTDAAVYVNAKQYNAILRRRKARAKEAAKNASASANASTEVSGRGVAKYASRSAHAKNRVRGKDGKYLTRAELLAGLGGPEAKARAEAREMEIAERAAKKKAREEKRELKAREKAALRASRAAVAAAAATAATAAAAAATTTTTA